MHLAEHNTIQKGINLTIINMTDTRRRVKLYALNAERQWDDKGTGHVSSTYVERLKGISLLVRAEADGKNMLLYMTSLRNSYTLKIVT